jgi:AcrR family transcriptional regulator
VFLSLPAQNSANAAEAPLRRVERRDPARTRAQILEAALLEFSHKGLAGARVDQIAARGGINKRMIYHYFGNKENLFLAVLERSYDDIQRREADLHLEDIEPVAGMRRLIAFSFNYYIENPHFIRLLNTENLHGAIHLKRSKRAREEHSLMVRMIEDLLERGRRAGSFRAGIDPMQLYISIAGLGFFYFSNIHTLSTVFGIDLDTRGARTTRLAHVTEVILGYLRPAD